MKFLKNILLLVFLFDVLFFISFFGTDKKNAASASIQGFGGRIQSIKPCVKPPGLMITVGPPKGGNFFLSLQSKIYDYRSIKPNVWVKGNMVSAPTACRGLNRSIGGIDIKNFSSVNLLKSFGSFKKRHLRTLRSEGYILKIGTSRF